MLDWFNQVDPWKSVISLRIDVESTLKNLLKTSCFPLLTIGSSYSNCRNSVSGRLLTNWTRLGHAVNCKKQNPFTQVSWLTSQTQPHVRRQTSWVWCWCLCQSERSSMSSTFAGSKSFGKRLQMTLHLITIIAPSEIIISLTAKLFKTDLTLN